MPDKKLTRDISGNAVDIIKDKFKKLKQKYSFNLDRVFDKAFNTAAIKTKLGTTSKDVVRQKIAAVSKMMSQDIDNIGDEQSKNVAAVIANAYAQGKPSLQTRDDIRQELGKSNYKIDRAVRTGTAYLTSVTKLLTWHEQGFTHYKWILGRNDNRTRDSHKRLHQRVFNIIDALEGKAPIPGRVPNPDGSINLGESMNCRCGVRLAG